MPTNKELLDALRELVVLKELKEECLRIRQRRPQSITRKFPQSLLDMETDYKVRKVRAWSEARRLIGPPTQPSMEVAVGATVRLEDVPTGTVFRFEHSDGPIDFDCTVVNIDCEPGFRAVLNLTTGYLVSGEVSDMVTVTKLVGT